MQVTGSFGNFYGINMLPAINRLILNRYKEYPPMYTKLFEVDTSTRSIEQISSLTGVGLFRPVPEGAALSYDSPVQGYKKTFVHSDFALGILVTHQMIRDDNWRIIKNNISSLVRSNRESIEVQAASVYNGAFTTTILPDGQPLISATHPMPKSGGVRSNLVVSSDLNMTSLQAAMSLFESQTDDAGLHVQVPYAILHIPPALRFKAAALLHSTDNPETANRGTNPLGYGMSGMPTMIVNPRLTDPDAWFLQASPQDTNLIWFWREKPYSDHWTDNPTRSAHHAMWYACSYGAYGDLGIVGTPGA